MKKIAVEINTSMLFQALNKIFQDSGTMIRLKPHCYTLYEGEFSINDRPNQNYYISLRKVNLKNTTDNFDADLTLYFMKFLEADSMSYDYEHSVVFQVQTCS